jgi:1-acyl-sn-glycerol-3-phosphate acyltransferase
VSPMAERLGDDGFDAFGYDPAFERRATPALRWLLERAFKLQLEGHERIPQEGRVVLVCNHAGALPWDAVVLRAALQRAGARPVRPLVEDAVMAAPFLGTVMNRLGCVRASQDNAQRLLARDEAVAVFPEGALGLGKLYRRRYKLTRFGRGGFVRLAVKTKAVLVPVAVLGSEDTSPLLTRFELPSGSPGGVPYVPITPLFPLLGPLGLLPLPARWSIRVLDPIDVSKEIEDPSDNLAVNEVSNRVRDLVQVQLSALVEQRERVFG